MSERWKEQYPEVARRVEELRIDLRKFEAILKGATLAVELDHPQVAWQSFALSHYPFGRLQRHYRELIDELEKIGGGPPQEGEP